MSNDAPQPGGGGTDSSDERLQATVARLRGSLHELARASVDRYVEQTPLYDRRHSPPHVYRQTLHNTRRVMDLCVRAIAGPTEDPDPPGPWGDAWHEGGEDRIREGLPVREYIRAWHASFEVLSDALQDQLADAPDTLRVALTRCRRMHDHLLREAVTAFEAHTRGRAEDTREAAELAALFRGEPTLATASSLLPENPVAVAAAFGPLGAEQTPDLAARTAAQLRKVRYLRTHLTRLLPGLRLADVRPDSAHLLLEGPLPGGPALAARLADAVEVDVLLATEPASDLADLPRASRLAVEVLAVGAGSGRTRTALQHEDVALEMQLSTPGRSLDAIRARCAPMFAHPELATTVREFLASDFDRRRTATALVVHPNTVDNRLAKVRELTGLDVHLCTDLVTLAVAVNPPRAPEIAPPGQHV